MNRKMNLQEIKRQVYLYYTEDGLVDVSLGLVILGFGLLLLMDLPAFVGTLGLIPLLIWYLGKGSLVVPRVGSIQLGPSIKRRFLGFFLNICLVGIGVFVLFLMGRGSGESFFSQYSLSLFGFVLALGISSLGLLMNAVRFYAYGALVFLAMTGGEFLMSSISAFDPFLVGVISAGAIILAVGMIFLIRFLTKYPVIAEES
jgi:hypothetical protein